MALALLVVVAGSVFLVKAPSFAAGTIGTSTTSQVSAASVTLGPTGTVSDTATVHGTSPNGSPTGSVNFYICQTSSSRTLTAGPCAAIVSEHFGAGHLTAGANNTSTASSGSFTPTVAGTWCFSAVYGGDSAYAGSTDNTTVLNLDTNECVLVLPAPSSIGTSISSAQITLGLSGSASDAVTVAGNVVGGSPTGGVTFYVCHTSVSASLVAAPCPAGGNPQDAGVALVPGAGDTATASSKPFVPTSVGTWCFSAVYGGSGAYAVSNDNTGAGNLDADECVLVAPPTFDGFTSDANASAIAGKAFSFLVTTSGSTVPSLKKRGDLPKGVHFVSNHDGTATISGTPNLNRGAGVYHLTIKATFGKGRTKRLVSQSFILTVT